MRLGHRPQAVRLLRSHDTTNRRAVEATLPENHSVLGLARISPLGGDGDALLYLTPLFFFCFLQKYSELK